MAFSVDEKRLATGGEDAFVRVWGTRTARAVAEFYGHAGEVIAIAFDKEEEDAMTAGSYGIVHTYRCDACVPKAELMANSVLSRKKLY
ncbi:hypothetical protein PO002_43185 [Cupriavidus necator]|uniref:WD40 repeat domain-containing protein n=1 Tax=Cupriavidus necator TaxID=106590 RepID=UPI0039C0FEB5